MRRLRRCALIAALGVATTPWLTVPAAAQFGLYTLPSNNFIWRWGDARNEGKQQGFADLDLQGTESGFNCHLTARLRVSADFSPTDRRQLENDLRTRLDFIYAASQEMNYLDQMRSLDWATLDCKRPEPGPVDEAKKAERENAARAKMLRELERRRAKQRDADN
ncbi:MAG TPA: hypothetical protein VHH11_15005 [Gammaproteobacteria bacterium]|jgi:hypothetical protein|nr:hypothetical protein [Gammaproteobacteria bacterium]